LGWNWIAKIYEGVSKHILKEMSEIDGVTEFVSAYLGYLLLGLVGLAIVSGAFYLWLIFVDYDNSKTLITMTKFIGNIVLWLYITWIMLFADGLITLIGAALVALARLGVIFSRAVMWRISRYPKGPLAGLL
jgi:hypothetical protein